MTSRPEVVAVIQARMSSTRLPGKVLHELNGKPVLDWVVDAALAAPGITRVVVATSDHETDEPILVHCKNRDTRVYQGSLDDVLGRFGTVIEGEELDNGDAVVRLTADCPLLDPSVIGLTVERFARGDIDWVTNVDPPTWPDGLDCELFSVNSLHAAISEATKPRDREHVGPFIRRNRHRFPGSNIRCPAGNYATHRWTLDTPDDAEFLSELLAGLGPSKPPSFGQVMAHLRLDDQLLAASQDQQRGQSAEISPHVPIESDAGFATSNHLLRRARAVVPLGAQTFSKSYIQFPKDHTPLFMSYGSGGRVFDTDGNEFVDLIAGLLPVVLGYRDPDVDAAIISQLERGISMTMSSDLEAQLAETLVRLVPCAEMVRYGKNGSDATSAAVRIARAATSRERVAVCGYHGWHDWYISSTTRDKGIPQSVKDLTHSFPYNDLVAIEELISAYPKQFAAIVLEPMSAVEPVPGFLEGLRTLCSREGIVLVFDEIITGFRYSLGGAQELFGVTPDLACLGKAMANGMPLSAVVGRADLMMETEEVFFSGTFGGEMLSLAASIATIDKLERENGIGKLWQTGRVLSDEINGLIDKHELNNVFAVRGLAPWSIISIADHPRARAAATKTKYILEMIRNGVIVGSGLNVMVAHNQADMAQILWAYDQTFATIRSALASNGLEEGLPCDCVQPVFSVR